MSYPIAIISFNRPEYLARTLLSIAKQENFRADQIALFQDGMYNPHSNKSYGSEELITHQVQFFQELFSGGKAFMARQNLGPAGVFDYAEKWIFEELKADVGYFFEDDMVLAPYYIRTLENMLYATKDDPRVGYCACYGPLWPAPTAPANTYVPMHMNWGFALRRKQWLLNKPYVDSYLAAIADSDYRDRPQGKVQALREEWGAPGPYTTQDVIKTIATRLTGGLKINTRACLGRYVGSRGLHIDQAAYDAAGFAKAQLYPNELKDFGLVTDDLVRWCQEVMDKFTGVNAYASTS